MYRFISFSVVMIIFMVVEVAPQNNWGYKGAENINKFMDLIGYPLESHQIITPDNYILTLHRVPQGRYSINNTDKPVILIAHGLLVSSAAFLLMGPDKSLALRLSDLGYDVWLVNARGNQWSRNHTTLNPNTDKQFWEFSLDEIAVGDLPATIEYILTTTNQRQLSYVGHSQGSSILMQLLAKFPEYNKKVNLIIAMAPAVYMTGVLNEMSALLSLPEIQSIFMSFYQSENSYELLRHNQMISDFGNHGCSNGSIFQPICVSIFEFISGQFFQIDKGMIPNILQYEPSGCSFLQIRHFLQWIKSGKFEHYDWGIIKNMEKYNQAYPPMYNIKNIHAPVAVYYSSSDVLVTKKNVEKLMSDLNNVVHKYIVPHKIFQHIDFMWAHDVNELLNNDVIETLSKYVK